MKRILVIRFSSLGDLVLMEPMYRAFRNLYSDTHITFVTSSIGKQLYEDSGYFDEIIETRATSNIFITAFSLRKVLRSCHYDYVFNMQGSSLAHLLTLLARKQHTIHISSSLWQKLANIKPGGKDIRQLLLAAGYDQDKLSSYFEQDDANAIKLPVSDRFVSQYSNLFSTSGIKRPIVALAPGASERWESKQWGDKNFALLAKKLQDSGCDIVLIGSSLELQAAEIISDDLQNCLNLTNKTSVGQLKSLLKLCSVLIGNDSGPAHIAAGVGTPTVTIFGSTGLVHCVSNFPYSGIHHCIAPEGIDCHPCYKPKCPTNHECMAAIDVDKVLDSALGLVQTKNLAEQSQS